MLFTRSRGPIRDRRKSREDGKRKGKGAHLKAQCEICSLDPRVVHPRRGGHGLARGSGVKRDEIICRVQSMVVHLVPQPRGIQIERMQQDEGRFVGVEGVDRAKA